MLSLSETLLQHRSIRQYRTEPIPQELIEEVCSEAIIGTSSSGNLNCVTMILTRDPERKQKLYELHFEQPMVLQAPLLITFCADWFRTREWLRLRGARDNFDNLIGCLVGAFDAMIVAQTVSLGFEARGLGICYMGTTVNAMPAIAEYLELPDTCLPVTTIVVGYPDEDPPKRDRLPLSTFLHDEIYRLPTTAELEATYAEREARGWERISAIPHLKAALKEHGITSLAQYYTSKIKYDRDAFQIASEQLYALLEAKHFLPQTSS
jgi:nitroreductase